MKFIIWMLKENQIVKSGIDFLFSRLNVDDKTAPIEKRIPLQFFKDKKHKKTTHCMLKWTEEWQNGPMDEF